MSTTPSNYDRALEGPPLERDARALLGQVMGFVAVAIAASIFLDIFNVFLLLLDLFGGRD